MTRSGSTTARGTNSDDYLRLTDDDHQQALYRLSAVGQYLYDTMADRDSDRRCPLPALAAEHLHRAQDEIDEAIKQGQRTRRHCLGGELVLSERKGPSGV